RNAVRPVACGLSYQLRVLHGRGANDDAIDALFEPCRDRRMVANSAAELHGQCHAFEDALDRPGIDRVPRECAIEIDHVQILEPLRLKAHGLGGCVAVEHGGSPHVSLLQTHAYAVLEIDGGKQDQGLALLQEDAGAMAIITAST